MGSAVYPEMNIRFKTSTLALTSSPRRTEYLVVTSLHCVTSARAVYAEMNTCLNTEACRLFLWAAYLATVSILSVTSSPADYNKRSILLRQKYSLRDKLSSCTDVTMTVYSRSPFASTKINQTGRWAAHMAAGPLVLKDFKSPRSTSFVWYSMKKRELLLKRLKL
jgi:hypothetical protein